MLLNAKYNAQNTVGPQLLLMQLIKASFDPRGMTQGQSKHLSSMWKTLDSVLSTEKERKEEKKRNMSIKTARTDIY